MSDQQFVLEFVKLVTISIGLVTISFSIVASIVFYRSSEAAKEFSLLVQRAGALQMLTVLVIISVAFVLSILKTINGESSVAILSGIAGYVLGGHSRSRPREPEDLLGDSN